MAKFDPGSLAIADSYAKTLLDLSEEAKATEAVEAEFAEFVKFFDAGQAFGDFLVAHAVDVEKRAVVLEKHFRGKLNDLLLSTLQVINRKGRNTLIPLIYERFRLAVEAVRNEVDVHVTSAVPLNDALRGQLVEAAKKVAGKTARLVEKVDPSILGGLVLRIGDEKLDGSVARQLSLLSANLHQRALSEIHGGKEYFEGVGT